jgi:NAD(P)-dependent dehydrogenase (short-subunit alcohol dehydrogenase family)
MKPYRFDGRVAVVTGAGRGIGNGHAKLLAELGAKVVVNDSGGSKEGKGHDAAPSAEVVEQIRSAGGTAVADDNSVATQEGCEALIGTAIREFGRIDIVVNNAGISQFAEFPEADADNLDRTLDVHVRGSWFTTRAAWQHMVKQGYGRVLMTTSTGMFGLPDNLAYATAKGALIGMMRSLAISGAPHGINVNCLAPHASTRRGNTGSKGLPNMTVSPPQEVIDAAVKLVAPMAAYLVHEDTTFTGEVFTSGGYRMARIFLGVTEGWTDSTRKVPTVEDVAEHIQEITAEDKYVVPTSLADFSERHLRRD